MDNQMKQTLIAVAVSLLMFVTAQTSAQTFTNLYNFTGGNDGANPVAGLILSGSTLYGTAQYGGTNGNGTVFKINTNGTGFSVLHTFTALDVATQTTNNDGANPSAALFLSGSTLYGTAEYGGTNGNGTVFKVSTNGNGFVNLYNFTGGNDGADPAAALILSGSTLYGTAQYGGTNGNGTVFKINTNGTGFSVLHSFTALDAATQTTNNDGANPSDALILSGSSLYGTAEYGGANGKGTVFMINTNGRGFSVLHTFTALDAATQTTNNDGANPLAGLIISGNTLYGTAQYGGTNANGTVFKVSTNGNAFVNLYNFTGGNDGANPVAGLIISSNTLYGTAPYGGLNGSGTVFKINTNGGAFATLYSFTSASTNLSGVYTNGDGANPYGPLTLADNELYGSAKAGGSTGNGTMFSHSTNITVTLFGYVLVYSSLNPILGVDVNAEDGTGDVFTAVTDASGYYSLNVTEGNWTISLDCAQLSNQGYLCPNDEDVYACCGGQEINFSVCDEPLQILTTNVPIGQVGSSYDSFLEAMGCYGPFSWTLESGSLPKGLHLNSGGEILGTPTNGGSFTFSVSVTDLNNNSIIQSCTLYVIPQSTATSISNVAFSNDHFTFTLNSASGQNFMIQYSTNLMDWITLFSSNMPSSSFIFNFAAGTNQTGYYRAIPSGIVQGPSVIGFSDFVYSVAVTNTSVMVCITRSGGLASQTCVAYATSDSSALAGIDYEPVNGTVCFSTNESSVCISIPLLVSADLPGSNVRLNLNVFSTNGTAVIAVPIVINYPPIIGVWSGTFAGSSANPSSGVWSLQIDAVDWLNYMASGELEWGEGSLLYLCDTNACDCIGGKSSNTLYFSYPVSLIGTNIAFFPLPVSASAFNVSIQAVLGPIRFGYLPFSAGFDFDTFDGVASGQYEMINFDGCTWYSDEGFITGWRVSP